MNRPLFVRRGRNLSFHFVLAGILAALILIGAGGQAQQKEHTASNSPAQRSSVQPEAQPQTQTLPTASPQKLKPIAAAQSRAQSGEGAAEFRNDNPGARERWFYEQRAYPLGYIPFGIRQRAFEAREAMRERERRLGIGTFAPRARTVLPSGPGVSQSIAANTMTWTPIGPQPLTSSSPTVKQASGRASAVAVDPTDPNIVYVGGAQGGVWKSLDGGSTWTVLTDSEASLAIGAIAIDGSAASCGVAGPCQIIYVGTGEQTNSIGSYYGAGILKSTDGGANWMQLGQAVFLGPGGGPFSSGFSPGGGARISSLAIRPGTGGATAEILAGVLIFQSSDTGTSSGIYRSVDGGNNWTRVLSGAPGTEVVFDPSNGSIAYAALGRASTGGDPDNGIYKSTDGGATWCALMRATVTSTNGVSGCAGGPQILANMGRIELAIAPSSPSTIYASIGNSVGGSSDLLGVFKTTNAGLNWNQLSPANALIAGTSSTCSAQCWYDHVIRVHPNNPNVVYLGGAATGGTAGNYFIRSTDGGNNWTGIANDGSDRLHVDIHAIAFSMIGTNASRIFVTNDGGLWSADVSGGGTGTVDWVNHNGPAAGSSMALGTLQYYPGHSIHPGNVDFTIGGTQDNGTHIYAGTLGWMETPVCGDGGFTAIDPAVPTTIYATCQNVDINKSLNSGANWASANGVIPTSESGAFIPPFIIDTNASFAPFARRQLYFGTFRVWRGDSDPASSAAPTWTAISPDLNSSADVRAIAVSPADSRIVVAGTVVGSIHRTLDSSVAGVGTWTNITGSGMLPQRVVTSLAFDPFDPSSQTIYATFSGFTSPADSDLLGHVFRTTNGGAAWTDITANLPNTPVNDIIVDPDVAGTLFVGTDIGVFWSDNGGVSWMTLQSGLPNVAVLGLKLHRPTRLLRAGTHGRGMWDLLLANFNPTFNLASISPTSAQTGDPDTLLTVNGVGFSGGSVVQFNDNPLATAFVSANQLTATIPAANLSTGQTAQINVFDAAQSPNITNGLPFSVLNPAPTLTSISPNMANPGDPGFALTLNGSNFIGTVGGAPVSEVRWNGSPRTTNATLVSNSQITVDIPASDVAGSGINLVTVFNPGPGGGTSNSRPFTVGTPSANDDFANAIVITTNPFTDMKDTSAGSQETGESPAPCAGATQGFGNFHSIWYRFTPTMNVTATANTNGSDFDTVLSVWTGSTVNALTNVACDDDGGNTLPTGGAASLLSNLALTANTTYFFMVGGFCDPADTVNCFASQVPTYRVAGSSVFNFSIPPDFAVSANPGAVTVARGQASAPITVTATPMNGAFSSAITFSCTGLPSQSTCVFNPTSVTPGANPATTQLMITTTAPGMMPGAPQSQRWIAPPVAVLALALLAMMLFAAGWRAQRARRAPAWALGCYLAVFILAGLSVSCGGGGGTTPTPQPNPGTQTGTFTVSVRGTSGSTVRTTNVTLTVQ